MTEYHNDVSCSVNRRQKHDIRLLAGRLSNHIALLRPSHWIKSLLAIPIGPVLMIEYTTLSSLLILAATIVMFVFASAAVYIINDLMDIERDRQHPIKRQRPLASGAVTPTAALGMLLIIVICMILMSFMLPTLLTTIVTFYLIINLGYSIWLKHVPILEMIAVASGFSLRTIAGYIAFNAVPDHWVVVTVLAGSLLLTVGKRREELRCIKNAGEHRPVLAHYTEPLLNAYLLVFAISCFGTGLMAMRQVFELNGAPALFYVSLPFLIYLLQRYLLIAFTGEETSNPTRLILKDRIIHLVLAIWVSMLGIGLIASHLTTFDELVTYKIEREVS